MKPPANTKEKGRSMLKATMVRLAPELHRAARIAALERDMSFQQLIADALESYLRKEVRK
jgi:predicted HicB family RNase H-like nuclease